MVADCTLTQPIQRLLQLAEEDLQAAREGRPEVPHYPSAQSEHQHSATLS